VYRPCDLGRHWRRRNSNSSNTVNMRRINTGKWKKIKQGREKEVRVMGKRWPNT
jgi:hypothetical protein